MRLVRVQGRVVVRVGVLGPGLGLVLVLVQEGAEAGARVRLRRLRLLRTYVGCMRTSGANGVEARS